MRKTLTILAILVGGHAGAQSGAIRISGETLDMSGVSGINVSGSINVSGGMYLQGTRTLSFTDRQGREHATSGVEFPLPIPGRTESPALAQCRQMMIDRYTTRNIAAEAAPYQSDALTIRTPRFTLHGVRGQIVNTKLRWHGTEQKGRMVRIDSLSGCELTSVQLCRNSPNDTFTPENCRTTAGGQGQPASPSPQ